LIRQSFSLQKMWRQVAGQVEAAPLSFTPDNKFCQALAAARRRPERTNGLTVRLPFRRYSSLAWRHCRSAADLLREHGLPVIDGPSRRRTADRLPALPIYFRDPDGSLLELMAANGTAAA
jgi:hypothetical protein